MKTRQPIGTHHTVTVLNNGHKFAVRFRPDQRCQAKCQLILLCFRVGWVIPMHHWAFGVIDKLTWEDAK